MAYDPRYYKPFVGTTETIADKAITGDKIGDKAVGTPQLLDDAVTEPKIKDETIESKDIKNLAIKTEDLANKSVTREKLADDAVGLGQLGDRTITGPKVALGTLTPDLFETPPLTRPIDPAVVTEEIQDGQVTHPKLAGDAVETVNIKDGEVTGPKLANDTVTQDKLAANSVSGLELKNGIVSTIHLSTDAVETPKIKDGNVTHPKLAGDAVEAANIKDGAVTTPKLATDAVETPKIKDGNVTHPKLAPDAVEAANIKDGAVTHPKLAADAVETDNIKGLNVTAEKLHDDVLVDRLIESLLSRRQIYYDDFVGAVLDDAWVEFGTAGGFSAITDSEIRPRTKSELNAVWRIWHNTLAYSPREAPKFIARVYPAVANVRTLIGLYKDPDNYIAFRHDTAVSPNWYAVCRSGGAETAEDTLLPVADDFVRLKIDVISYSEVNFYIDGALKKTITTNVYGTFTSPIFEVKSLHAGYQELRVDKVLVLAKEFDGIPPP